MNVVFQQGTHTHTYTHTCIHDHTTGVEGNAEAYNVFDACKCNVLFAVSVVGLEHINDENIAVTVLRASVFDS